MRVIPQTESAGTERPNPGMPDVNFSLLGSAMASGLCLDLMIERLLERAGEVRA